MSNYNIPPHNNVPFTFSTGGYSAPNYRDIAFRFGAGAVVSAYAGVGASIVGVRDYVKECPTYVVGYGSYGVQIIKGRCIYGGIRDIGAYIMGVYSSSYGDLTADIIGFGYIRGQEDLAAFIRQIYSTNLNLSANIDAHYPVDLGAYVKALKQYNLPTHINPVVGVNLTAFIRTPPERDLRASLYSWDGSNLNAYLKTIQRHTLTASIGGHAPADLVFGMKGWVREANHDLGAYVFAYPRSDLNAILRSTYQIDLVAALNTVLPVDLAASLYSWGGHVINASIFGGLLDTDISAQINSSGAYENLIARVCGVISTGNLGDLSANILSTFEEDLSANVNAMTAYDLGAMLFSSSDIGNLAASIYPKMISLTTIISFVTMEHFDLSATMNICMGSESRNLSAYLNTHMKDDLNATIVGKWDISGASDLGSSIGTSNKYFALDKLPINVYVGYGNYWSEDKLPINLYVSSSRLFLSAYINGVHNARDVSATVTTVVPNAHTFEASKSKEYVYYRGQLGERIRFEVAEISFRSIVEDYFYISGTGGVYKTDRMDKWVTDVKSYIPRNVRLGIKRRFHKMISLHDLSNFSSIDEAVRYAIDYVTEYPEIGLGARITGIN